MYCKLEKIADTDWFWRFIFVLVIIIGSMAG
jgi:hypothetical protein